MRRGWLFDSNDGELPYLTNWVSQRRVFEKLQRAEARVGILLSTQTGSWSNWMQIY
jgi:hypothetical protein